jgi:AcrR family transcriptional regulator
MRAVTTSTTRWTADERREAVLDAAFREFARRGLHGASTDTIARAAGISQPYLFRLFGSKKELYMASVDGCYARTLEDFKAAVGDLRDQEAFDAISGAYREQLADPDVLRGQVQAYGACEDPDIRARVQAGYGSIVEFVERVAPNKTPGEISAFMAQGMLFMVIAAMGVQDVDTGWARRLLEGCAEGA